MRWIAAALAVALAAGNAPSAAALDHASDRLLVKLRADASALPGFGAARAASGVASLDPLLAALGATSVERLLPEAPESGTMLAATLGLDRWCVVRFADGIDVEAARATLAGSADVETAELDFRGE